METLSTHQERIVVYFSRRELIAVSYVLEIMLAPGNVSDFSPIVGASQEEGAVLHENFQWLLGRVESFRLRRRMRRNVNTDYSVLSRLEVLEIRPDGALIVLSEDHFRIIRNGLHAIVHYFFIRPTPESSRPAVAADIKHLWAAFGSPADLS